MPQAGHSIALPSCKGARRFKVDPLRNEKQRFAKRVHWHERHSVVRRVPKGRNHLKENTYMTERSQVKGRAIRGAKTGRGDRTVGQAFWDAHGETFGEAFGRTRIQGWPIGRKFVFALPRSVRSAEELHIPQVECCR